MTQRVRAVAYAAKSTDDKRGSIPTQFADARELAAREGLVVVAEFSDEAKSAFKGNRGRGLEQAKAECERLAREDGCSALIVQHSDRLARGDAKQAMHLVQYAVWAIEHDVAIRSVQDLQTFGTEGLVYAALMGDRNTEDSKRKSAATRDGLKRRKDRGQPVGAVPIGYVAETTVDRGAAITRRVSDPIGRATVERIFDLIEAGNTPGQVSRLLNAEGAKTVRGGNWTTRAVRRVVTNDDYCGGTGYPLLIASERWELVNAGLRRLDPAAVQARKGGRPNGGDFMLAGLAFCLNCGAPMRLRRYRTGTRVYRCRNAMEGIGLCDSQPVRADMPELHVLHHLEAFVGDAERWLIERVRERNTDREQHAVAVARLRSDLAALDRKRGLLMADYEAAVIEGDSNARLVLEVVARLDREREGLADQIATAEALVGEPQDVGVNEALDFYAEVVDVVRGKLKAARGVPELNAALASVLAGVWLSVVDGRLRAEFELRMPDRREGARDLEKARYLLQHVRPVGVEARRVTLPPGAEPDPSPWCTSTRTARRSPGTTSPRP